MKDLMEFAAVGALLFIEYLLLALVIVAVLSLALYVFVRVYNKAKQDALKSSSSRESK